MALQQIKVRLALREATEALLIAYWSDQPKHHLERAQTALIAALCGGEGSRDDLIDLVERLVNTTPPDDLAETLSDALIRSAIPNDT